MQNKLYLHIIYKTVVPQTQKRMSAQLVLINGNLAYFFSLTNANYKRRKNKPAHEMQRGCGEPLKELDQERCGDRISNALLYRM